MIAALRRIPPLEGSLLALAVVLLIFVGVLKNGAQTAPSYDSYSSYDAADGGYRAFYDLLAREGLRVERFESRPAFLTGDVALLVYAEPLPFDPVAGQSATAGDAGALEAWVRGGGRLLYLGHDEDAAKNGVLHLPFSGDASDSGAVSHGGGVPRSGGVPNNSGMSHGGSMPRTGGEAQRESLRFRRTGVPVTPVMPPGVAQLQVSGARRWHATKGDRVVVADRKGPVVVSYPFGRGHVTAVIDETLFDNGRIGNGDAARLAYGLAADEAAGGRVAFDEAVHGHIVPLHWWSIVPLPFALALAAATVTLLIAFAGAAVRFGPPLLPVARDDRTSADFIDALSSLLARGGAIRTALTRASDSTAKSLARALGLGDEASNDAIAARIEDDASRAAFREMLEISRNGFPDERNLVRGVALAQRLRKDYAAHGRPSY